MNTETPVLSAHELSKAYPGVVALRAVSLAVAPGSVHALVGENGAGKSTLVKIVTGAIAPDSGWLEVAGTCVASLTPRTARDLGISVIHQERQIAHDLTVAENVLLGRMPRGRCGGVSWQAARRRAAELLEQVGLDVDPRGPVAGLGVAQLQAIEIARALAVDARLLVMDEPTSALGGADVQRLFATIRSLREGGVSVVYISHHLDEIFSVADTVTVLRDGRHIVTRPVAGLGEDELVELMLGRRPEGLVQRAGGAADAAAGEVVLRAVAVTRQPGLHGVSLDVRAREVLCVTGSLGSGRRELARCLAGIERPDSGSVESGGATLRGPRHAIANGVVFLPEDRKREGLLLALTVFDNLTYGELVGQRSPIVRPRRLRVKAFSLVERLRIRTPSLGTPVRLLSGGNQQKVVLGRWLSTGARVFVFDEPTAGIDVGTKLEIYQLLRELATQGAAVVLFSSDYEEIKLMADRAVVLRRGLVAGELRGEDVTEERLIALELAAA